MNSLDYVQIVGVDNIMNKILDPIQVGFTSQEKLVCTCKAVPKREALEKVGVVCKKGDLYDIVEYTELPEA